MLLIVTDRGDDASEARVLVAKAGEEPGAGGDEGEYGSCEDDDAPGPRSGVVDVEGRVVRSAGLDLSAHRTWMTHFGRAFLMSILGQLLFADRSACRCVQNNDRLVCMQVLHARPAAEWPQLFAEAWRAVRDEYAEPVGPSGVDWPGVYRRYVALLPRVATRDELGDVISEMLAELGRSHVWQEGGEDNSTPPDLLPGVLGADFAWCEPAAGYRLTHIVRGDTWHERRGGPLAKPGMNATVGDVLVAVNGTRLSREHPPERALIGCAEQEVLLSWLTEVPQPASQSETQRLAELADALSLEDASPVKGGKQGKQGKQNKGGKQKKQQQQQVAAADSSAILNKNIRSGKRQPEPAPEPASETPPGRWRLTRCVTLLDDVFARYRDAIVASRARVHELSAGRCGYLHLPDCERLGYAEFQRHYLPEAGHATLVLDVRSNAGGNISELVLAQLAQRVLAVDIPRWGQPTPYPTTAPAGPLVLLTDESAGSDGDLITYSFRQLGLGSVVGHRTWGGCMDAGQAGPLVDGGGIGFPVARVLVAGGQEIEGSGAEVDIEVVPPPQTPIDVALEAAVAEALRLHSLADVASRPVPTGYVFAPQQSGPVAHPWPFAFGEEDDRPSNARRR